MAKTLNSRATDSDHIPCVVESKVFANRRREPFSYELGNVCETVQASYGTGGNNTPIVMEYHSQALRIKPLEDDVSPTIPAGFGEGGANTTTPVLIIEPLTFNADSGKNGNGIVRTLTGDHNDRITDMTVLILEPIVLESNQNHATITQSGICPTLPASMGMGGGYTPMITEPITYDAQVTNPLHRDQNDGGVCHTLNNDSRNYVVIPIEGNGARPSHYGNGYRDGGAMYSLNTTEVHAVAYGFEPGILKREGEMSRVSKEVSPTLRNNMGDNQTAVAYLLKIRGGNDTYIKNDGSIGTAGKGPLIQIEKSATIAVSQDQILFQPINNSE